MDTPEINKMKNVSKESHAIGRFLDWLEETKGWQLAVPHKHTDGCYRPHKHGEDICMNFSGGCRVEREKMCDFHEDELTSPIYSKEKLLAEYYGIDLNKVEEERREILDEIRKRISND